MVPYQKNDFRHWISERHLLDGSAMRKTAWQCLAILPTLSSFNALNLLPGGVSANRCGGGCSTASKANRADVMLKKQLFVVHYLHLTNLGLNTISGFQN